LEIPTDRRLDESFTKPTSMLVPQLLIAMRPRTIRSHPLRLLMGAVNKSTRVPPWGADQRRVPFILPPVGPMLVAIYAGRGAWV